MVASPLRGVALGPAYATPAGPQPRPRQYCRACRTTPSATTSTCSTGTGTRPSRTTTGRGCASTRPSTTTPKSDVWAITQYDDVLAIEKDAKGVLELQGAAPARRAAPDDDRMDDPLHQRRRSLVYHGFTPKRVRRARGAHPRDLQRDHRQGVRARRVRLRVGHRRSAPAAPHRRHARLRARARTTTCSCGPTTSSAPPPAIPTAEVQARVAGGEHRRSGSSSSASSPTGGRSRSSPTSSALLCHAEVEGERLDDESIVQETLLILIGGDETTRHVITGGQLALFEHPDQRDDHARRPGGDARPASRRCCAGSRRSRTCRARWSHDVELARARRSTRATR